MLNIISHVKLSFYKIQNIENHRNITLCMCHKAITFHITQIPENSLCAISPFAIIHECHPNERFQN